MKISIFFLLFKLIAIPNSVAPINEKVGDKRTHPSSSVDRGKNPIEETVPKEGVFGANHESPIVEKAGDKGKLPDSSVDPDENPVEKPAKKKQGTGGYFSLYNAEKKTYSIKPGNRVDRRPVDSPPLEESALLELQNKAGTQHYILDENRLVQGPTIRLRDVFGNIFIFGPKYDLIKYPPVITQEGLRSTELHDEEENNYIIGLNGMLQGPVIKLFDSTRHAFFISVTTYHIMRYPTIYKAEDLPSVTLYDGKKDEYSINKQLLVTLKAKNLPGQHSGSPSVAPGGSTASGNPSSFAPGGAGDCEKFDLNLPPASDVEPTNTSPKPVRAQGSVPDLNIQPCPDDEPTSVGHSPVREAGSASGNGKRGIDPNHPPSINVVAGSQRPNVIVLDRHGQPIRTTQGHGREAGSASGNGKRGIDPNHPPSINVVAGSQRPNLIVLDRHGQPIRTTQGHGRTTGSGTESVCFVVVHLKDGNEFKRPMDSKLSSPLPDWIQTDLRRRSQDYSVLITKPKQMFLNFETTYPYSPLIHAQTPPTPNSPPERAEIHIDAQTFTAKNFKKYKPDRLLPLPENCIYVVVTDGTIYSASLEKSNQQQVVVGNSNTPHSGESSFNPHQQPGTGPQSFNQPKGIGQRPNIPHGSEFAFHLHQQPATGTQSSNQQKVDVNNPNTLYSSNSALPPYQNPGSRPQSSIQPPGDVERPGPGPQRSTQPHERKSAFQRYVKKGPGQFS